ncbi:MAG: aminotransferase class III-fold pyridoxal phosphate-dependent enzyme, partial [Candidatus Bipolaricaulis sp.]|nr:aminotransferase class III-fold pyridoxal phosphate-dependent enzyme [Candidatus Bipolaricaulis sp.]
MVRKEGAAGIVGEHTYGTWQPQASWKTPLHIARAEGVFFFDQSGKRYLDFSSQLMCSNLGHGNQAIIDAICRQARELPYVAPSFSCDAKEAAVAAMLEVLPPGLDRMFFSTSGTEANEAALKLARQIGRKDGKYKVISRYRSYHGSTAASIALTGDPRRWAAEPSSALPGVVFAPDAYCYRCPFGLSHPQCGIRCAEYVEYMIEEEGHIAAMIVEPVVGTNGIIVPPDEYLPRIREITRKHGVLLIADEVMSGWYRTGTAFAVDRWGVVPDILTTAKGCSGAYTPVAITVTSGAIKDAFETMAFSHGHTYTMHPLALSAIPPAVSEYKKLVASGRLRKVSDHLGRRLRELADRHASVGDVRGIGHFWAVELVRDRTTKEPFNTKADKAALRPLMTSKISATLLERGVYLSNWYNHFVVAPPLIISEAEVDLGIEALDEALTLADR